MNRFLTVLTVLAVVLLAMGFAAANAGHRTTLVLGFLHFYRVPVTLGAFGGGFVGMVLMFITGIHSDLKVRRILRERLAEESHQEQVWIDRNQQDLFSEPEGGSTDPTPSKVTPPGAFSSTATASDASPPDAMPSDPDPQEEELEP